MATVQVFVNKGCRVILQEVAGRFSIGKASAHQILHQKLGMSKWSARRVQKQLTEDQKASRVTIAKEHLGILTMMKISFWTVLSLGKKCGFIMLNLKQKLSQSSGKAGSPTSQEV